MNILTSQVFHVSIINNYILYQNNVVKEYNLSPKNRSKDKRIGLVILWNYTQAYIYLFKLCLKKSGEYVYANLKSVKKLLNINKYVDMSGVLIHIYIHL